MTHAVIPSPAHVVHHSRRVPITGSRAWRLTCASDHWQPCMGAAWAPCMQQRSLKPRATPEASARGSFHSHTC